MSAIYVHMLPPLMDPQLLRGGVAVVIDVLRASTTIIHALAHGARAVLPCGAVDEAQARAQRFAPGSVLLGGERHGELIPGFDLDNSPLRYTPEVVAGKTIVFTTTNGTRALAACGAADRVLLGAFVNRAAVVHALRQDGRPVHLVCAGTDGHLTAEDILFAGSVADEVIRGPGARVTDKDASSCNNTELSPFHDQAAVDDPTQVAIDFARVRCCDAATRRATLRNSRGGRNLLELGLDADIDRACELDRFDLVPEWSRAAGLIQC